MKCVSKYLSSPLQILPHIVSMTWLNSRYNNDLVISPYWIVDKDTNVLYSLALNSIVVAKRNKTPSTCCSSTSPRKRMTSRWPLLALIRCWLTGSSFQLLRVLAVSMCVLLPFPSCMISTEWIAAMCQCAPCFIPLICLILFCFIEPLFTP